MDNSCIYILYWDINKPYIGQTVQFHIRRNKHLNEISNGKHCNYKILNEYSKYNTIPTIEILQTCQTDKLNDLEEWYIKEFDSINNGLNIISGGYSVGFGVNNSSSKYTREQLIEAFQLLSQVTNSYKYIAEVTGIAETTVKKIGQKAQHTWLHEEFPEISGLVLSITGKARFTESSCAASKNKDYRKIKSPEGIIYEVTNTLKFSKEHDLPNGNLCSVLAGKRKSVQGWVGVE